MTYTPPPGSQSPSDVPVDLPKSPASPPNWSRLWISLGLGLLFAGLAYGVGRLQGARALVHAEQAHAEAFATAHSALQTCEVDRGLLTVRRKLAQVALSLERRNFGLAESHRRQASQALEQPSLTGLQEVTGLSTTIGALNLSVDPDPGAKREQVIAASEVVDRLVETRLHSAAPVPAAGATQ
jgi:hypothetical protein